MRKAVKLLLATILVLSFCQIASASIIRGFIVMDLKWVSGAIWSYEAEHGVFPTEDICDREGKPLLSWRVRILPYFDQTLYKEFHLDEPWDSPHNRQLIAKIPNRYRPAYRSMEDKGKTCLVALRGPKTFF